MMYFVVALLHAALSLETHAQTIPMKNVTPAEFAAVTRELSANAEFTTVSGAGTLGTPLSFEVGVTGGITSTPRIDAVARDAEVKRVPNAAIVGSLALPFALTAEAGWLPRVGGKDFKLQSFGLGLKWTPTDVWAALPLDLAVRAQMVNTRLDLRATIDGANAQIGYVGKSTAFEVRASRNLGILTPYLGVGVISAQGDMNASGASVFNPLYVANQRATAKPSGALFNVGLELHFLIFDVGVEYARVLKTDRLTAKLAFGF